MANIDRCDDVSKHLQSVMRTYWNDSAKDRVKQAFLSLIRHSDAVTWAEPALDEDDIEHLTAMIMKCLYCANGDELLIPLDVGQSLSGYSVVIDYYDVLNFLAMHSEDIYCQAMSRGRSARSFVEVDEMWVGIVLRYRYCALGKDRYFPVSAVLELREVARRLSGQFDCGDLVVCLALETLGILESNHSE